AVLSIPSTPTYMTQRTLSISPAATPFSNTLSCSILFSAILRPPSSTLFPYTTLFRSRRRSPSARGTWTLRHRRRRARPSRSAPRSEEHTSELQSRFDLVCRLLLEKKKEHRQEH